ncbi:MAG: nucleotidyltransferase family protein [Clostridia bacterium]|nr:nucleotidyltransferase family protein [Clostridia bacterium]
MYKNTAVICETNPFHNGHACVFRKAKEDSGIVTAVMSGNFVQRGLPAVWDKYTRAALLLENGADIVVELPYPWSVGSVEAFSLGGVAVAMEMGCDRLMFGSESGDMEMLRKAAEWLEAEEERFSTYAVCHPDTGAAVLYDMLAAESGFSLFANDKLGVWYLRQMKALDCRATAEAVKRLPAGAGIASASTLRDHLAEGRDCTPFVPASVAQKMKDTAVTFPKRFYDIAHTYFRLFAGDSACAEGEGGLWERLKKTAYTAENGTDFLKSAATKKYTDARIRRTALFGMTGIQQEILKSRPLYTILLAAGEKGREWLRNYTLAEDFTVLTKPADRSKMSGSAAEQYDFLCEVDSLYGLCMNPPVSGDFFLKKHPIIG